MRYDIGYTRNFNRFLGGISRLSNVVGDNHILLVPVHDQMCLITFVPCFISSSERSEVFQFKILYTDLILVLCTDHMHAKAMVYF